MKNNHVKLEVLVFYGALFFTCVVGIIELLPEFDNWLRYDGCMAILFQTALSLLYFGLLIGVILSFHLFLRFYKMRSSELPSSVIVRQFLSTRMKWIYMAVISFVFISMYLVKGELSIITMSFVFLFIIFVGYVLKKTQQ
jgi:L-asparagine transporter-like permease